MHVATDLGDVRNAQSLAWGPGGSGLRREGNTLTRLSSERRIPISEGLWRILIARPSSEQETILVSNTHSEKPLASGLIAGSTYRRDLVALYPDRMERVFFAATDSGGTMLWSPDGTEARIRILPDLSGDWRRARWCRRPTVSSFWRPFAPGAASTESIPASVP